MTFRKTLIAFFLSVVIGNALAQDVKNFTGSAPEAAGLSSARLARIDNMIEAYVSNEQLPGAVAFLVQDGKIVYHKAFGFSDIEKENCP
jgi:CubicO group peptidase (beta-lactamase class C family)